MRLEFGALAAVKPSSPAIHSIRLSMNFFTLQSRLPALIAFLPLLAGAASQPEHVQPGASRPAVAASSQPIDRAGAIRMFNAWKAPVPPRRLLGSIHYVGAIGVSSYLITTRDGHILLDTGFEDTVPIIRAGVEQLGFQLRDIKLILSSHAHIDHTGGHATMKQLTGAAILASAADARVLESGGRDDFIPFPQDLIVYPPVQVDRIVQDRERVTLGDVTLTAHLTPGHTRGATTWTMEVTESGQSHNVVFFSSASLNSGTRLLGQPAYPEIVDDFERTFNRLKSLPCDVFFAPHGGQFAMAEKFARLDRGEKNPFVDPEGWRALLGSAEKAYRDQLAAEQAAANAGIETPAQP
jgi:metallo-beta-lactamase class B